ncbi:DUF6355 family natural product biosynthesis protein [Streptomyces sp. WAC05374]
MLTERQSERFPQWLDTVRQGLSRPVSTETATRSSPALRCPETPASSKETEIWIRVEGHNDTGSPQCVAPGRTLVGSTSTVKYPWYKGSTCWLSVAGRAVGLLTAPSRWRGLLPQTPGNWYWPGSRVRVHQLFPTDHRILGLIVPLTYAQWARIEPLFLIGRCGGAVPPAAVVIHNQPDLGALSHIPPMVFDHPGSMPVDGPALRHLRCPGPGLSGPVRPRRPDLPLGSVRADRASSAHIRGGMAVRFSPP